VMEVQHTMLFKGLSRLRGAAIQQRSWEWDRE
jgi:hypothetical protein